jgi:hypothetical protein
LLCVYGTTLAVKITTGELLDSPTNVDRIGLPRKFPASTMYAKASRCSAKQSGAVKDDEEHINSETPLSSVFRISLGLFHKNVDMRSFRLKFYLVISQYTIPYKLPMPSHLIISNLPFFFPFVFFFKSVHFATVSTFFIYLLFYLIIFCSTGSTVVSLFLLRYSATLFNVLVQNSH